MQKTTILKLNQINQDFYQTQGESFSQTRQSYWSGWTKLLPFIQKLKTSPLKVLDVGCGNGRFERFLREKVTTDLDYTGTDNSQKLLKLAKEKTNGQLIYLDLISHLLSHQSVAPKNKKYDLIVLFGVLHHIPDQNLRKRLLTELANQLEPGGLLILTVWRFAELDRFKNKLIDPQSLGFTPAELEVGDWLVGWRTDGYRYAHALSNQELSDLLKTLPPAVGNFLADGRDQQTNHYWLIKKH